MTAARLRLRPISRKTTGSDHGLLRRMNNRIDAPSELVRRVTLPNGLRSVMSPQPALHEAHLACYVRTGSRFETSETNGLSHFLEHMIYRGTRSLVGAHDVSLAFERLGADLFADTHVDFGTFSITLPPESLEEAAAIFADVLLFPEFHDVAIEQDIVCEEILEDLDDAGRQVNADNRSRALIYPTHPLGFTITGDEPRVRSFDEVALRRHHGRHYTAPSMVIALSGAVDEERAARLVEQHFSRVPPGARIACEAPLHAQERARLEVLRKASSQTDVRVCFRAIAETDPRSPALELLLRIIDDGMSTRLYHTLCDTRGLCYSCSAGFDAYEDDGVVDVAAEVRHARVTDVVREVLALVVDLGERGPRDDELEKAKRRHAWELRSIVDSAEDLAGFYAGGLLFERFETVAERIASLARVTRDEVQAAARLLAVPQRLNVVAVGLLEKDERKALTELVKGWSGVT